MRGSPAAIVALFLFARLGAASPPDNETLFETQVRPLFAKRCAACHNGKVRSGGFSLDSREAFLKGGNSGLAPGEAIRKAVRGEQPFPRMPFGGALSADEIQIVEIWTAAGAPWPEAPAATDKTPSDRLWSLRPVRLPAVPKPRDNSWARTDIDRFVLAKLEEKGLKPGPDADRRTLLRRVYFDLIGLPPTPEQSRGFLRDSSANAFAKVVDGLLASPRYGERWGRHWLDVARYADSEGDAGDYAIPQAYLYRDWVIKAFNQDLPYDEFLRDQIAGDILARQETDAERYRDKVVATGFVALARRFGNNKNDMYLTIEDTIDTLGRGVLGLTLRCARCHDHKFDPLTSSDYYGIYGIFASSKYPWLGASDSSFPADLAPLSTDPEVRAAASHQFDQLADYVRQINDNKYAPRPVRDRFAELTKRIADAKSAGKDDAEAAKERAEILTKYSKFRELLENGMDWLKQQRDQLGRQPMPCEMAFALSEGDPKDAPIQLGGDPQRPGRIVPRHFVEAAWNGQSHPIRNGSGRLPLADWIVDPANPLTRRVIVNRIWQWTFGRGIVATSDNFGHRGESPTHPELLDYLATVFAADGWSIKALQRRILLSRVYQLSGETITENAEQDPATAYLWRYPARRLEAEPFRDAMLAVSGELDLSPAGPQPFAPWYEKKYNLNSPLHEVFETNRRSVYFMTQRLFRNPFLELFDGADTNQTTSVRESSQHSMQALYLMNSPFVAARAAGFSKRILASGSDDSERVKFAFETAFGREASPSEIRDALAFIQRYAAADTGQETNGAWSAFARGLLRSNEFFFVY